MTGFGSLSVLLVAYQLAIIHGAWVNQEDAKESPLQLIRQGKLSMGASYGHLYFPIKISQVERSFDDLEDVVEAYEHYALQGGAAKAMRYSINRLRTEVSLISGFVKPGQLHLALEEDAENQIEDALTRQHLSRKKRSFSKVSQWLGITGFGSSLYTAGQVGALKKDMESQSESQQVIAQKIGLQSLRINNLTRYVQSYHGLITDAISQLSVGTKKAAMEIHGRSIQLTLEVYKNEIKDFIIGLTALMNGKLHPLMIEPSRLSTSYQDLIKRANQAGLTPIIEDPSILFNCSTSTLSSTATET